LSPDQVVRQPDWGFQDRPLTRKSSDWESTNINSKVGRPDPCRPGNPIHVLLTQQHSAENRALPVPLNRTFSAISEWASACIAIRARTQADDPDGGNVCEQVAGEVGEVNT
jgi:hypothetical protein